MWVNCNASWPTGVHGEEIGRTDLKSTLQSAISDLEKGIENQEELEGDEQQQDDGGDKENAAAQNGTAAGGGGGAAAAAEAQVLYSRKSHLEQETHCRHWNH